MCQPAPRIKAIRQYVNKSDRPFECRRVGDGGVRSTLSLFTWVAYRTCKMLDCGVVCGGLETDLMGFLLVLIVLLVLDSFATRTLVYTACIHRTHCTHCTHGDAYASASGASEGGTLGELLTFKHLDRNRAFISQWTYPARLCRRL